MFVFDVELFLDTRHADTWLFRLFIQQADLRPIMYAWLDYVIFLFRCVTDLRRPALLKSMFKVRANQKCLHVSYLFV